MKVIGLAGWSGAGKTTLLANVIPHLVAGGLRVSTIKHAHHNFDVDIPGKDLWKHREAGASEVLVSSGRRWALMHELRGESEPHLSELIAKLSQVDLVLVEGFRKGAHPRVEVYREGNNQPLMFPDDAGIVGVISDVKVDTKLPTAHLDDIPAIARLLQASAIDVAAMIAREKVWRNVMSVKALDLRGLKCPMPVLRTRKALKTLKVGERIEVECTDPLSVIDIPTLIRETGDHVEIVKRDESIVFMIEKRAAD